MCIYIYIYIYTYTHTPRRFCGNNIIQMSKASLSRSFKANHETMESK